MRGKVALEVALFCGDGEKMGWVAVMGWVQSPILAMQAEPSEELKLGHGLYATAFNINACRRFPTKAVRQARTGAGFVVTIAVAQRDLHTQLWFDTHE
jgi:hypothetical protein